MAVAMNPQTHSIFFELPLELRYIVYGELFKLSQNETGSIMLRRPSELPQNTCVLWISQTCRLLFNEVLPEFYKKQNLEFREYIKNRGLMRSFIDQYSHIRLDMIRHLTIKVEAPRYVPTALYQCQSFPNLSRLRLIIQGPEGYHCLFTGFCHCDGRYGFDTSWIDRPLEEEKFYWEIGAGAVPSSIEGFELQVPMLRTKRDHSIRAKELREQRVEEAKQLGLSVVTVLKQTRKTADDFDTKHSHTAGLPLESWILDHMSRTHFAR